jgi:hypothetical protein
MDKGSFVHSSSNLLILQICEGINNKCQISAFSFGNFNNGFGYFSSSTSIGTELRDIQMSEVDNSAKIHLGIGPRHLWNVRPETTQKGFY